jgi:outer membrane receptor protein involved in Fe transport
LKNFRKRPLVALIAAVLAAPALAQTPAAPPGRERAEVDKDKAKSETAREPTGPTEPTAAALALPQVVVTATRGSKAVDRIPGAVSVITREELDEQLRIAEDLSAVLAVQVPGYSPSSQKLTSFGESMRGRAALILFDGIPVSNPLRAGAREGYFADPLLVERIEVVSGPSAVQGLGATGGIINYISRTPRKEGTVHTLDAKFGTQGRADDATVKLGYMLEHKQGAFDALVYVGGVRHGVGLDGDGRRLGLETIQGDLQDSTGYDAFVKLGGGFAPAQRLQVSFNRFRIGGDGDWTRVPGNRAAGIPTSASRRATTCAPLPSNGPTPILRAARPACSSTSRTSARCTVQAPSRCSRTRRSRPEARWSTRARSLPTRKGCAPRGCGPTWASAAWSSPAGWIGWPTRPSSGWR